MTKIEMYKNFREEIDEYCIPLICDTCEVEYITFDTERIGMLCTIDGYIDCVYVVLQYRRKGYAKNLVLSWYERNKNRFEHITLHIVNNNSPALKFWNSVFNLRVIERNNVDTFYEIVGVRGGE